VRAVPSAGMERFLFVVPGTGLWAITAALGFHLPPVWVAVSAVLALLALLGISMLVRPLTAAGD
jgi:hypothetical protein